MVAPLVVLWLFIALGQVDHSPVKSATAPMVPKRSEADAASARHDKATTVSDPASALYDRAGLAGIVRREVFDAAYQSIASRGLNLNSGTLAIADMSQPSTAKRLVVVDLGSQDVLLQTWVAHGQGSGGLMAEHFSNKHESHQTSLGLYRVGEKITSPKHGAALLLHGLDEGVNDEARDREVIIHGADYVSEQYIAQTGRLGRSWGCPAVSRDDMTQMISTLADGGLLFVHGS